MTRRTIVFLHPSDELYGADRVLLDTLDALPDDVTAQVWLPTDLTHPATPLCAEIERRGVRTKHVRLPVLRRAYRTPAGLARLAIATLRLIATLRRTRPDVVYCTTSAAFLGLAAARRAHVPTLIGHVHEVWTASDARVLTPLAARADRLLATSNAVVAQLPVELRERTRIVANAAADPGPTPDLAARSGPLRYVVASRWSERKGYRTLLRAWDLAGCPGQLVVLGAAPPSGDAVDVTALAAALPRPASVEIVGEVADPSPYLAASDVAIVPSDEPESFGLVVVEAFAHGRPAVVSAAGGLVELVADGVDGWQFPAGDTEALATLLRTLVRDDVVRAGHAARERYEQAFTLEHYRVQWRAATADVMFAARSAPATSARTQR